ncbi:MAG TPA: hypothetical protein VG755_38560 [Nannocystaceae bacterium]|nr:hypothetical protein [Nannocystaceae bacterium]
MGATLHKILFLAANPRSMGATAFDLQQRNITERINVAHRQLFELESRLAVRTTDLQQAMLEVSPTIVHFSVPADGQSGIVLQGPEDSDVTHVSAAALSGLFTQFSAHVKLVVLSAALADEQVRALADTLDAVVAMRKSISDGAAVAFSLAFYQALAFGKSVRVAFDLGVNQIQLDGYAAERDTPVLMGRRCDADEPLCEPDEEPFDPAATYDVFINYSHHDDQILEKSQCGWVAQLEAGLVARMTELLSRAPTIYRSVQVGTETAMDDRLRTRLKNSATAIAVVSPAWVRSGYCPWELAQYVELRKDSDFRVFKAVKEPVEQEPVELAELPVYAFHTPTQDNGARPLRPDLGGEQKQTFLARAFDLAESIVRFLQRGEPTVATNASGPVMFLACTSADLRSATATIRNDLEGRGFTVLSTEDTPSSVDDLAPDLARAHLSIHTIGDPATAAMEQALALAEQEWRTRKMPRLIWLPAGARGGPHSPFVQSIRTEPARHEGADIVFGPIDEMREAVLQHADEVARRLAKPALTRAPGSDAPPYVYLVSGPDDKPDARSIRKFLEEQRFDVLYADFEESVDEGERRRAHEEYLALCDAYLVHYGKARDYWVRRQLRELRRAGALERRGPVGARAVFVTPPTYPDKPTFVTNEPQVKVIRSLETLQLDLLREFIADVLASSSSGGASQ